MEYWFNLPESFNSREFLPELSMRNRLDDCCWLMSTILTKMAFGAQDRTGFVRLHSDILRRVLDKRTVAAICAHLENGGAIETTSHHIGEKTRGYRIGKRFLDDRHVCVEATDRRLLNSIERERERMHGEKSHTWRPIHNDLNAAQHHLTICGNVDELLAGLPPLSRLCQDVIVANIMRRNMPFSVGSTLRFTTR